MPDKLAFPDAVSAAIVQAAGTIVASIASKVAHQNDALKYSDEIMGTVMAQLVKHAKATLSA